MPGRNDPARQTGPALEKHYRFLAWLLARVEKFPRSQKFTLGDCIAGRGRGIGARNCRCFGFGNARVSRNSLRAFEGQAPPDAPSAAASFPAERA